MIKSMRIKSYLLQAYTILPDMSKTSHVIPRKWKWIEIAVGEIFSTILTLTLQNWCILRNQTVNLNRNYEYWICFFRFRIRNSYNELWLWIFVVDELLIAIIVTAVSILSILMTIEQANITICNNDYCTYDFDKRLHSTRFYHK